MSQTDTQVQIASWVRTLIEACRETQFAFEAAAGVIRDRLLRAELIQYSGQRREFIAELIAVAHKLGGDTVDPGSIREPLARHSEQAKAVIGDHDDVASVLEECERSETRAMSVYRDVSSHDLPLNAHAMVSTHLAAMTRVRDRLNRLRNHTHSDRN